MMNQARLVARTLAVSIICIAAAAAAAAESGPTDMNRLPSIRELPDPFRSNDGKRVTSRADWEKRRLEIRALVLEYEYGRIPDNADPVKATENTAPAGEVPAADAKVSHATLHMGPDGKLSTKLVLTIPSGKGPFPVVVTGDLTWGRVKEQIAADVLRHGYMLAEFDRTDIAPDKADKTSGVYPLYPDSDWGALAAWAWGYGRTIDYLITRDDVDKSKIIVTGHSRGGKAALLAGALDPRVSLTVPNGSGCGGAGCYRVDWPLTEDLKAITTHFPYWFAPKLGDFVGHVDQLPFDQHEIKALVAPRALLSTDSLDDLWANPIGTEVSYLASKEVFAFLGAPEKTGLHFRHGPHAQNEEDWAALIEFADWQLKGKAPAQSFDRLPFPQVPPAFNWKAPTPDGQDGVHTK